jgi:DNA-3-methyladenine glycosylase I
MARCPWGETNDLYIKYHDEEWGVPVHDDRKHFEFLTLEAAQAGLSWLTILRKRESYRRAYDNLHPLQVPKYDDKDIARLLQNEGIVRNHKKIEASVDNAGKFMEVKKEFGSFDNYIWRFGD